MGRKLAGYLMASAVALVAGSLGAYAADDDFSLAMVIKSTTNPYYNATLAGAKMAAEEIGGTVENYGPTQSSATAQVDIINNLADRHIPAIAVAPSDPDAVAPGDEARAEARRQGHHVRRRFGARRAAVPRQHGDHRLGRPVRRQAARRGTGQQGQGRDRLGPADRRQPERLDRGVPRRAARSIRTSRVVDEVYGYDNEQKAFDATVALTTKYPDLAGIYAPTCPGLPAVARALESVNKGKGKIKLAGMCVPSITSKYMLDGTIQVFYLWDPIKLGYVTYYAAKLMVGRQDRRARSATPSPSPKARSGRAPTRSSATTATRSSPAVRSSTLPRTTKTITTESGS